MCRVLGYLGPRVGVDELVTKPANSLINQTFDPQYHDLMQLAGTGIASWDTADRRPEAPLIYRSCQPSFYDRNLHALCRHISTTNLLAHVRATGYSHASSVNDDNCHPFLYPNFRLALAHNGGLPGWRDMLHDIVGACKPEVVRHLSGSTDTEPMYCLLMSQYEDPTADMGTDEIIDGLVRFMKVIVEIKKKHDQRGIAKLKFFLADGNDLVVANMGLGFDFAQEIDGSFDEWRHAPRDSREYKLAGVIEPVWYLAGRDYGLKDDHYGMDDVGEENPDTIIISSEHLTDATDDWKPVAFQHVVFFKRQDDRCAVHVKRLDF